MDRATRAARSRRSADFTPSLGAVTGLVYVILIAIWGVVLVPRLLRRNDVGRERRASARLESALSSASAPMVDDSADIDADWSDYARSLVEKGIGPCSLSLGGPEGLSSAARRRRKIVVSLGGGLIATLVGGVVGVVPGSFAVLIALVLGAYVAAMAYVMGRSGQVARPSLDLRTNVADLSARRAADAASGESSPVTDGVRLISGEESRDGAWEARETTLPTYVTKPRASKIPRRIDLTARGWTGADMVERARQQQPSRELEEQFGLEWAAVEPDELAELEELVALPIDLRDGYHRKAVNE